MKTLIVYDSMFGNTEKVAKSMGNAITADVAVLPADKASSSDVKSIDLLIVGSPTQAFKPTKPVQTFLRNISEDVLAGMNVAAFDTRMAPSDMGRVVGFIVKIGGYAAPRIARALEKKGGTLVVPPEGFFVTGKEGPLRKGELDRASNWAKEIVESYT